MENFYEFENTIINKLKDSDLIERFSFTEIKETPNLSLIIKMFEEPSEIEIDGDELFFFDENGDKVFCPDMYVSISDKGNWLSDKIPLIDFDIDQSGNIRKASEAEALFCLVVVGQVLDEVKEVAKGYDFNAMKPINENGKTFKDLLNEWLSLQSIIINILVSACKYKISDYKLLTSA